MDLETAIHQTLEEQRVPPLPADSASMQEAGFAIVAFDINEGAGVVGLVRSTIPEEGEISGGASIDNAYAFQEADGSWRIGAWGSSEVEHEPIELIHGRAELWPEGGSSSGTSHDPETGKVVSFDMVRVAPDSPPRFTRDVEVQSSGWVVSIRRVGEESLIP